jgi:plastocyanin
MRNWMVREILMGSAVLTAMTAACGDGGGGSGPPPDEDPVVVQLTPTGSGNGQTGTVGEVLPDPLRVVITKTSEPQAGVVVNWATPNGGSLAPASSNTGADGIATSAWTLGPNAGSQTATATVAGADGSPVSFTATAEDDTPPPPPPPPPSATVQVLGPSGGNRFDPISVTIQAGQTVLWVWPNGSEAHNVEPDAGQPASSGPLVDGPNEYSFTFTTAGTYAYFCANHGGPGGFGMSGTVIVQP